MTSPICVSGDFDFDDDGKLVVAVCGTAADQALNEACDTNSLHRDPDCGLWVASPQIVTRLLLDTGQRQLNRQITPTGPVSEDSPTVQLANTECRPVHHVMLTSHQLAIRLPGNGGGVSIGTGTGLAGPGNGTQVGATAFNDGPATRTYNFRIIDQITFVSPAGATQTIQSRTRVDNIGVGNILWQINEVEINIQSITEGS